MPLSVRRGQKPQHWGKLVLCAPCQCHAALVDGQNPSTVMPYDWGNFRPKLHVSISGLLAMLALDEHFATVREVTPGECIYNSVRALKATLLTMYFQ